MKADAVVGTCAVRRWTTRKHAPVVLGLLSFLLCVVLTSVVAYLRNAALQKDRVVLLDHDAINAVEHVRSTLASYTVHLASTAGAISSAGFSAQYFRSTVGALVDQIDGLRNLHYCQAVSHSDRAAFESSVRSAYNFPNLQITEAVPNAALTDDAYRRRGNFSEYLPKIMSAKGAQPIPASGFDLYSEPVRLAAVREARAKNSVIISTPVRLLNSPLYGVVIVAPIFSAGATSNTPINGGNAVMPDQPIPSGVPISSLTFKGAVAAGVFVSEPMASAAGQAVSLDAILLEDVTDFVNATVGVPSLASPACLAGIDSTLSAANATLAAAIHVPSSALSRPRACTASLKSSCGIVCPLRHNWGYGTGVLVSGARATPGGATESAVGGGVSNDGSMPFSTGSMTTAAATLSAASASIALDADQAAAAVARANAADARLVASWLFSVGGRTFSFTAVGNDESVFGGARTELHTHIGIGVLAGLVFGAIVGGGTYTMGAAARRRAKESRQRARVARAAARAYQKTADLFAHEILNPLNIVAGACELLANGLAGDGSVAIPASSPATCIDERILDGGAAYNESGLKTMYTSPATAADETASAAGGPDDGAASQSHSTLTSARALARQDVDTAAHAVKDIMRLLKDASDLSALRHGKMRLHPSPCSLQAVIHQVVRVHEPFASVPIRVCIARSVPPVVVLDPLRLQQLVSIGLSNAVKAAFSGSILVHVAASIDVLDEMHKPRTKSKWGICGTGSSSSPETTWSVSIDQRAASASKPGAHRRYLVIRIADTGIGLGDLADGGVGGTTIALDEHGYRRRSVGDDGVLSDDDCDDNREGTERAATQASLSSSQPSDDSHGLTFVSRAYDEAAQEYARLRSGVPGPLQSAKHNGVRTVTSPAAPTCCCKSSACCWPSRERGKEAISPSNVAIVNVACSSVDDAGAMSASGLSGRSIATSSRSVQPPAGQLSPLSSQSPRKASARRRDKVGRSATTKGAGLGHMTAELLSVAMGGGAKLFEVPPGVTWRADLAYVPPRTVGDQDLHDVLRSEPLLVQETSPDVASARAWEALRIDAGDLQ